MSVAMTESAGPSRRLQGPVETHCPFEKSTSGLVTVVAVGVLPFPKVVSNHTALHHTHPAFVPRAGFDHIMPLHVHQHRLGVLMVLDVDLVLLAAHVLELELQRSDGTLPQTPTHDWRCSILRRDQFFADLVGDQAPHGRPVICNRRYHAKVQTLQIRLRETMEVDGGHRWASAASWWLLACLDRLSGHRRAWSWPWQR